MKTSQSKKDIKYYSNLPFQGLAQRRLWSRLLLLAMLAREVFLTFYSARASTYIRNKAEGEKKSITRKQMNLHTS